MQKKKLVFVGPHERNFRSFMQTDLELLKKQFDVRLIRVCFAETRIKCTLEALVRLIIGIAGADVVFCWFATRESFPAVFLARLFNKRVVVAVGGADVITIPELEYGLALHKTEHFYQMFVLNNASKVLPISRDAESATSALVTDTAKVTRIYLGVDVEKFHPSFEKKAKVITVGVIAHRNLDRKGLETFVKSAAYVPDAEFVLIGEFRDSSIDYLRSIASSNIRFAGLLPENELIKHYQEAKVYVQASAHEGFGVAMAEAMACECVPVVTDTGAIPEIVGDTGIYVPYGDPAATSQGIRKALNSEKGKAARARVKEMFTIERRQKELVKAIEGLLD